jgi:membrane glycosyltransferase
VAAGIVFAVLSVHISWAAFLWLLPIAGALMLSPLVSWASGLPELGRRMWHWNIFRIPEEAPRTAAADQPSFVAVPSEALLEAAE